MRSSPCRCNIVLLSALLGLIPVPAPAGEVQTFPAKSVDLSAYKTYQFLPTRVLTGRGVLENDPEVGPLIVAALRKALIKKGLREVGGGADLEVAAGALAVSIPQIELIIYNLSLDASVGTSPITTIGRYNREGTLIVNFIDPHTKKSVWLGFARKALGKPSNLDRDIDKAAQALFKKYPSVRGAQINGHP